MKLLTAIVFAATCGSSVAMAGQSEPWMNTQSAKIKKKRALSNQNTVEKVLTAPGNIVVHVGKNAYVYGEGAFNLVGKAGRKTIRSLIRSGKCVNQSNHPGDFTACAVKLSGDVTVIVYKLGVYQGANAAYFIGSVGQDVANELRDVFRTCARDLGPVAGTPCQIVAITFNASGQIVKAAGVATGNTLVYSAQNGGEVINNVVDIPVNVLRLKPKRALKSGFKAVENTLCLGVDVVAIVPRFLVGIGGKDIGSACNN